MAGAPSERGTASSRASASQAISAVAPRSLRFTPRSCSPVHDMQRDAFRCQTGWASTLLYAVQPPQAGCRGFCQSRQFSMLEFCTFITTRTRHPTFPRVSGLGNTGLRSPHRPRRAPDMSTCDGGSIFPGALSTKIAARQPDNPMRDAGRWMPFCSFVAALGRAGG